MAKVTYASLKLKVDNSSFTFDFNGNQIEVLKYLPIDSKYDLVEVTLQKSKESNGYYNPLKVDMYFHLHLVYMYTNISFTDKQREDEAKLYDTLYSNGVITKLLETIDKDEYEDLLSFVNERINTETKFNSSLTGVINKFINELPANAEAAMNIVENFDKDKFQEVINFAQAANGGRPVTQA